MAIPTASQMASAFGLMGNGISLLVYLAPVPTFRRICKRKSTEGFQSLPYSVALFSAMLLLYYGHLKKSNGLMIITINTVGCVIEAIYLILFMIYATREAKVFTTKLILLFNIGAYGMIIVCTIFVQGPLRVTIVGWICAVFSVCVFAAPLSIIRLVIRTKSVEYMPFALSFFLTICAVMWFFFGFFTKDYFIATPNILGFVFGIAQMALYIYYKDSNKQVLPKAKVQDLSIVIDLSKVEMEMVENFHTDPNKLQKDELETNEKDQVDKPVEPDESNV